MVINHTMTTVTREGGARTNTGSMKKSIHSLTNMAIYNKILGGSELGERVLFIQKCEGKFF